MAGFLCTMNRTRRTLPKAMRESRRFHDFDGIYIYGCSNHRCMGCSNRSQKLDPLHSRQRTSESEAPQLTRLTVRPTRIAFTRLPNILRKRKIMVLFKSTTLDEPETTSNSTTFFLFFDVIFWDTNARKPIILCSVKTFSVDRSHSWRYNENEERKWIFSDLASLDSVE